MQKAEMTSPSTKLYGPKQILLIAGATLVGIGFYLVRRYHETGVIGPIEIIASGATAILATAITIVMVRKGNKPE